MPSTLPVSSSVQSGFSSAIAQPSASANYSEKSQDSLQNLEPPEGLTKTTMTRPNIIIQPSDPASSSPISSSIPTGSHSTSGVRPVSVPNQTLLLTSSSKGPASPQQPKSPPDVKFAGSSHHLHLSHHNQSASGKATSSIRSKLRKLHSSPALATLGTLATEAGTAATNNEKGMAPDSSGAVINDVTSSTKVAPEPNSPSGLPSQTSQKKNHGFSLHRHKQSTTPHEPAPSPLAQARKQAVQDSAVPFSFGSGSISNILGTASDLNYASNISSYQSSQRPVPQPGSIQARRTFSFSKLGRRKSLVTKKNSLTLAPDFHSDSKHLSYADASHSRHLHLTGRKQTFNGLDAISSDTTASNHDRVSPARFLPPELQVQNWSLQAKYTSSKITMMSKGSRVLGKGATATVKIVQSNKKSEDGHKQLYAAKVYHKCKPGEKILDHYSKLASEYLIAHRLFHRNVVHIYDLCMDSSDSWCAIMDYCDVGDLFSLIESYKTAHRKMGKEERNCLFKQLLLGVQYIHYHGIAHRDIKPENLLLNSKGELKISDFGVAMVVFDETKGETEADLHLSSGLAGSIPYLPPEVFDSQKDPENHKYDARLVDIWSCGCTFINLVIGAGFFGKASLEEDPGYVRFVRELNRYWQHEKGVNAFLIEEGETAIDNKVLQNILNNAAATNLQVELANKISAAAEEESEDDLKKSTSIGSTGTSTPKEETSTPASPVSPVLASTTTPTTGPTNTNDSINDKTSANKLTRSYIMNMTEEQQPLFFFNEFGDSGKRLLAHMLMPDPALRPQISQVMDTPMIKRLGMCQPADSPYSSTNSAIGGENGSSSTDGVSLPTKQGDFKKFKQENSQILKHSHLPPVKGPSLLGLGFKDPYKDMY